VRKNNNVIKLNGKRYDARTGAALWRVTEGEESLAPVKPLASIKKVRVQHSSEPPKNHHTTKHAAPHHLSRTPEPASTLMRQAVSKPTKDAKPRIKAYGHTDSLVEMPQYKLKPKQAAQHIDEQRLKHAHHVPKSRLVSRFSAAASTPRPVGATTITPSLTRLATPPLAPRQPHPETVRAKRSRTTADLLDRAVQQATSHRQPAPKPSNDRLKRNASISATVALAVVVLGIIFSQNLPNARLQMASAKAGFSVSLPTYRPAGYSLGQLNYTTGVISAQFKSNSDGRHYSLTQKQSSWDSATLRDSFVAATDPGYQTVSAGGRTIYLYSQGSATWVNGGIWYTVQSDGSLSQRQLVDLASSQ
jgi:hypothetical protein